MTETEALDEAARVVGYSTYAKACTEETTSALECIENYAATFMENAALKAENERLRKAMKWALEIITDSWGDDQIEQGDDQAANILRAALKEIEGD